MKMLRLWLILMISDVLDSSMFDWNWSISTKSKCLIHLFGNDICCSAYRPQNSIISVHLHPHIRINLPPPISHTSKHSFRLDHCKRISCKYAITRRGIMKSTLVSHISYQRKTGKRKRTIFHRMRIFFINKFPSSVHDIPKNIIRSTVVNAS